MTRPNFRRNLRVESLESRELLTSGGPTAQQQYMVELLNQARMNPAAMADRVTSNLDANVQATVQYYNVDLNQVKHALASSAAKPPLAWNDQLAAAATGQSQDQANTGVQSHTGSDGSDLNTRLDRAGYGKRTTSGENAFAYSTSVDEGMEAFLIDWGVSSNGHRNNILQPNTPDDNVYREVGIGIVNTNRPGFGPKVITQDFGAQAGAKAELLGVAYNDPNHTHFYAPGQGRGDVTIEARNEATGKTVSVQTWDSGGYQIPLDPGTYKVTARVGDQVVRSQDVLVGSQNIKVDYDLSDPWQPKPSAPTPDASSDSNKASTTTTTPTETTTNASVSLFSDNTQGSTTGDVAQAPTAYTDSSFMNSWISWTAAKKS